MIILSLAVFAFSSWAVFSHRFNDGIVVKNFLSLSAIISFLAILDHDNITASLAALTLLTMGMIVWCLTHRRLIRFYANRPHKTR